MAGDELRTLPGSEQFASERVHVLLPFGGTSERPELLLGTFNRGLFRYDGQSFQPFQTEADEFLRTQTLYKGTALPDGTLGLSTISGGAVILDPRTGRALRYMNLNTGLPSDNGLAIFADRSGIVWLGLEGAICQVETPSPLTRFDIRAGLSGSVSDVSGTRAGSTSPPASGSSTSTRRPRCSGRSPAFARATRRRRHWPPTATC